MALSRKQRVLLAHLTAASERAVSVAVLCEALALADTKDPRHALEAHVSRLRTRLEHTITRHADGYALPRELFDSDVQRFDNLSLAARNAVADGDLTAASEFWTDALALWRGRAFEGLEDHPVLAAEIARLDSAHDAAVAGWVDVQLLVGHHREAIERLEELLAMHPLREQHWGRLVAAHHAAGHASEALATLERARRIIDDALGIRPGRRLAAIHEAVLHERSVEHVVRLAVDPDLADLAGQVVPAVRPPEPTEPVLVGRKEELDGLLDALQASRVGFRSVTVTGDAGIGKTTLLQAFVHRAVTSGAQVHAGRCPPTGATGFDPVRELLRRDLESVSADARLQRLGPQGKHLVPLVADLLPGHDLGTAPTRRHLGDLDVGRLQVFEAFVAWLTDRAHAGTVCLVVDDLHWADEDTLDLLDRVAQRAGPGVLLVTTRRDDEPPSRPSAHPGTSVHLGGADPEACHCLLDAEIADRLVR